MAAANNQGNTLIISQNGEHFKKREKKSKFFNSDGFHRKVSRKNNSRERQ